MLVFMKMSMLAVSGERPFLRQSEPMLQGLPSGFLPAWLMLESGSHWFSTKPMDHSTGHEHELIRLTCVHKKVVNKSQVIWAHDLMCWSSVGERELNLNFATVHRGEKLKLSSRSQTRSPRTRFERRRGFFKLIKRVWRWFVSNTKN